MASNVYVDAFNLYYGSLSAGFSRRSSSSSASALVACQFPPVLADARGEIRQPARS
jgi:hypothetical protein